MLLAVIPLVSALASETETIIIIKDHHFTPSSIAMPAGQKLKLIIRNENSTKSEFESDDLHQEKIVPPGSDITLFIGPLTPGTYEFFDDLDPDTTGHLIIK